MTSLEKKTYGYRERDEAKRQAFLVRLRAYATGQLVYVDESGVDNTADYAYRWCERQILSPLTFNGYCDSALVEAWVEQCLVPQLRPEQVVLMDNASFHKSVATRELIDSAGCELLFMPPYSPNFNKIEKFWARLKHYLRKTIGAFESLWDCSR